MRLQGGPLHVGWRCREHLVYVCVQPSGGAVDVPTAAHNRSPYYFTPTEAVTCLMTRLPV